MRNKLPMQVSIYQVSISTYDARYDFCSIGQAALTLREAEVERVPRENSLVVMSLARR
jgi:hypothetical protein